MLDFAIENPHISLLIYGRLDRYPPPSSITRIKDFVDAGVNVAIGQDDMDDPYYPYGRGHMLGPGYAMCHGANMSTVGEIDRDYDMI